ncbi:MAG: SUF system Fe-S cluster assembly regulator [Pseudobdellovibrionaceae bacterium]
MIKLSKMADYAIVLLNQLSRERDFVSSSQLSVLTLIPEPTIAKIMKLLSKAGLVDSLRGACGGYKLAKSAKDISATDIIEAVDGPVTLTSCVSQAEDHCAIAGSCALNGRWNKINASVRNALSALRLEDLR